MLVLTRKVGQTIVIDGGIRLTITAIRGKQIRVALDAPREVAILRDELPRRIVSGPEPTAQGPRYRGGRPGPIRARMERRPAR
jgi:carbon storage regulator